MNLAFCNHLPVVWPTIPNTQTQNKTKPLVSDAKIALRALTDIPCFTELIILEANKSFLVSKMVSSTTWSHISENTGTYMVWNGKNKNRRRRL